MGEHVPSEPEQGAEDTPIVALLRHNLWANLRLLDACAGLDERQLATTVVGTYGSIYDTLKHILMAEQGYLTRLSGRPVALRLRREERPEVAELRAYARQSGEGLIAVAAGPDADRVHQMEWDGLRWSVPAGLLLTQAVTHATEHRAQVMAILTQLEIEPPDLSGWAYIEEHLPSTPVE